MDYDAKVIIDHLLKKIGEMQTEIELLTWKTKEKENEPEQLELFPDLGRN